MQSPPSTKFHPVLADSAMVLVGLGLGALLDAVMYSVNQALVSLSGAQLEDYKLYLLAMGFVQIATNVSILFAFTQLRESVLFTLGLFAPQELLITRLWRSYFAEDRAQRKLAKIREKKMLKSRA